MRETLFHICSPRVYGILLWDPVFGLLTESCVINDDGVCTGFREHEEVIESAEVVIKGDKGEVLKKVKPPNTVRKVTLFKEVCRNYKNNEVRDAILEGLRKMHNDYLRVTGTQYNAPKKLWHRKLNRELTWLEKVELYGRLLKTL